MFRFFIFTFFAVMLIGCASPGFLGQPMQEVTVAESRFRVYMRSGTNRVEAHRVSMEARPSRILTLAKAVRAIEIATGCEVKKNALSGDQAIIKAKVNCQLP